MAEAAQAASREGTPVSPGTQGSADEVHTLAPPSTPWRSLVALSPEPEKLLQHSLGWSAEQVIGLATAISGSGPPRGLSEAAKVLDEARIAPTQRALYTAQVQAAASAQTVLPSEAGARRTAPPPGNSRARASQPRDSDSEEDSVTLKRALVAKNPVRVVQATDREVPQFGVGTHELRSVGKTEYPWDPTVLRAWLDHTGKPLGTSESELTTEIHRSKVVYAYNSLQRGDLLVKLLGDAVHIASDLSPGKRDIRIPRPEWHNRRARYNFDTESLRHLLAEDRAVVTHGERQVAILDNFAAAVAFGLDTALKEAQRGQDEVTFLAQAAADPSLNASELRRAIHLVCGGPQSSRRIATTQTPESDAIWSHFDEGSSSAGPTGIGELGIGNNRAVNSLQALFGLAQNNARQLYRELLRKVNPDIPGPEPDGRSPAIAIEDLQRAVESSKARQHFAAVRKRNKLDLDRTPKERGTQGGARTRGRGYSYRGRAAGKRPWRGRGSQRGVRRYEETDRYYGDTQGNPNKVSGATDQHTETDYPAHTLGAQENSRRGRGPGSSRGGYRGRKGSRRN